MGAAASMQHFMTEIQLDNSALISPQRFAERLAMEQQELARFAGVNRNTLARSPQSAALQGYLRDSVRVIAAATDVNGDADRATYWYRNQPLGSFRYKTPSQVVSEGKTEDLLRYLELLDAGAAG
jgi:uncharacterized protein (DUF2384 family)